MLKIRMCQSQDDLFDGIAVLYAAWDMPPDGVSNYQAAYNVKASAIDVKECERIAFCNCRVAHTGAHGIWMSNGSKDCLVERSIVEDVGAGAVLLGDEAWKSAGYQKLNLENRRPHCERLHVRNSILRHGGRVLEAGENVPEIFRTADAVLKMGRELPCVRSFSARDGRIHAEFDLKGHAAKGFDLCWTSSEGEWSKCQWERSRTLTPAADFSAAIPEGTRAAFVNLVLDEPTGEGTYPEFVVSTKAWFRCRTGIRNPPSPPSERIAFR